MQNRTLSISLILAGLAVFFIWAFVSNIESRTRNSFGNKVSVLVAAQDIKEMSTIEESMITTKSIPRLYLEPGAIVVDPNSRNPQEELEQIKNSIVGSVAVLPLKKSEQISRNKISEPNLKTGLATQISPGRRAVTIPINDVSGVNKLLKPGDRVDVIAIVDNPQNREIKVARTIAQDVPILAVGQYITNNLPRVVEKDPYTQKMKEKSLVDFAGYNSITLEVEQSQAQMMVLTVFTGQIFLTLRNNDDTEKSVVAEVFSSDLGATTRRLPATNGGPQQ